MLYENCSNIPQRKLPLMMASSHYAKSAANHTVSVTLITRNVVISVIDSASNAYHNMKKILKIVKIVKI